MTLRLVPDHQSYDPTLHWNAKIGEMSLGVVHQQPGGAGRGKWQWFISRVYQPGWHWNGSEDTRDGAMRALGARFREWLEFAGLEETDDPTPQAGPPYSFTPSDEKFWPVTMPAGFKVGHVSRHLTSPVLITEKREVFWSGYITTFHEAFPGRGSSGPTPEAVLPKMSEAFRAYLARSGLRERP